MILISKYTIKINLAFPRTGGAMSERKIKAQFTAINSTQLNSTILKPKNYNPISQFFLLTVNVLSTKNRKS